MTAKAICFCNSCGAGIYDTSKAMVYPGDPPALICRKCEMQKSMNNWRELHARCALKKPDELIQTILKICTGG